MAETILVALSLSCFAYGFVIRSIRSGTKFYLSWFAFAILFLTLAIASHLGIIASAPLPLKIAGIVIASLLALIAIAFSICIARHFNDKGPRNLDYLIVLGAQVRSDGPSAVLRYRLDTAAAYLAESKNTLCIVTGAKGYSEPFSEAQGMRDYLVRKGVDPTRIIMEDQAVNTNGNIKLSMKLMRSPLCSAGIVTNDFHVFRGVAISKKMGLENSVGIAAPSRKLYLPNNVLREYFGISKDILRGNI